MSYADFDDDFQEADVPEHTEETPCGQYQCEITRFFDNETQNGTPRLNCVLQVVSGEHTGKTLFKSWLLTQSAMPYIKADFKRFGLPVETTRFCDLRPMLDTDVIGKWCEVVKKPQKDTVYFNVYINAMLDPLEKKTLYVTPRQSLSLEEVKEIANSTDDDLPF